MFLKIKTILHPLWIGFLHLLHRLLYPVMTLVILYALLVSSFTALTPWARTYQPKIQRFLQQVTHQKVDIADIRTSWYGWYPVIKVEQLKLTQVNGEVWNCHECWLGIDLIRSLLYWHLHPGMIYVDGVRVEISNQGKIWHIKGFPDLEQEKTVSQKVLDGLTMMLSLMPEKVLIKNMQIKVNTPSQKAIILNNIRVLGQKKSGKYHWSAEADLGKKSNVQLRIDIPLLSNLMIPQTGRVYFQTSGLELKQIPGIDLWLKEQHVQTLKGEIKGDAWLDWDKGQIAALHTQLKLKHFILMAEHLLKPVQVDYFTSNTLWRRQPQGWEMAMDGLDLQSGKYHLEQDKFLLFYQNDWNSYHLYVKHLPLAVVKNLKTYFPKDKVSQWNWMPKGELSDVQLNLKNNQIDYFLTQFKNLSWTATSKYPGIKGLSGGISWEPDKTHLELSSSDMTLMFKDKPDIHLDDLQTIINLETNTAGSKNIAIERMVLSRPDLALTLQGHVDEFNHPQNTNARLLMHWSMEQGQQWLPYLPLVLKKSGLRDWLMSDIKRIRQSSGEMVLNGLLKDFPFDQGEGEFSVNAHLYGVDLFFQENWPLTRQIDGHLKVHQRELETNIDKALLDNIPIEQITLRVPYLGQNKEVLLVHGQVSAKVQKMIDYLQQSPLKERAKAWKPFGFKGVGHLDLKLDVPLYKERQDILASGQLKIDEQNLDLNLFKKPLNLKHTQGYLDFDADGVIGGDIQALIGADKISLKVEHHADARDTLFHLNGGVGVDELKTAWGLENFNFISGHLPIEGTILLPNYHRKDWEMDWHSSLVGVQMDLPEPWHKEAKDLKPLDIGLRLAANGALDMHLLYQQKDFRLGYFKQRWDLGLEEPDIAGHLFYTEGQSTIEAKLTRLYLDSVFVKSHQKPEEKPWDAKTTPAIDLEVADFRWDGLALGSLKIDGAPEGDHYELDELKLSSPYYDLVVHGNWHSHPHQHIDVNAQMMISNLGQSLELWHMTPAMNSKEGYLDFQGTWEVALNQVSLKNLEGQLAVRFKKGNITHLDKDTEKKIGLGKLLSIVSLQTLPRRLQLDFSDLSNTGFTYDVFKGNFTLHDGLLTTKDTEMDGPIAYLKMHGGLNVLDKWYDLELQVYPYITASLPVAATIVGGPLAGVATWAASNVINKGMQQVSGYTYKITGPWNQPVVQHVSLMRKKTND